MGSRKQAAATRMEPGDSEDTSSANRPLSGGWETALSQWLIALTAYSFAVGVKTHTVTRHTRRAEGLGVF